MSHAETVKDSAVIASLRKEIDWLRSTYCETSGKERSVGILRALLTNHAQSGKGLILSRREYITPEEVLTLLRED